MENLFLLSFNAAPGDRINTLQKELNKVIEETARGMPISSIIGVLEVIKFDILRNNEE